MALGTRRHSLLTGADIGSLVRWTVAGATARLALTLTSVDNGRLAHQLDDNSYHILADYSVPTWVQLGNVTGATSDPGSPTVNEDELNGYSVGDVWVNTTTDAVYVLVDATAGAAVWTILGVSAPAWGDLIGTLSDQLDLQAALDAKVDSVFGRGDAVIALPSDYDASQVDNDSGVPGTFVSDALDYLNALDHDKSEDEVALNNLIGSPTIATQEDVNRYTGDVSRVNGSGVITDDGDGSVTVSAGFGFIRATDSESAMLYKLDWAETPLSPIDNELNYIYVEWNAGSPQMVITTSKRSDLNTNIYIGSVYRSGIFLHETTHVTSSGNVSAKLTKRFNDTDGLQRAAGSVTSESGTRNIAISSGTWWHGLDETSLAAHDTSVADTFIRFYRDGVGGWTLDPVETQIDNLSYDDGSGVLATLTNNRYGVHWVYVGVDDDLYVIFGRGNYTLNQAVEASPPADVPPHMQEQHAGLVARIIVQKSAASFADISYPWTTTFTSSVTQSHSDLADLSADDHTHYLLADGTRAMSGALDMGTNAISNVGNVDGRDVSADGTAQDTHIADGTIHFTEASIAHGNIGGLDLDHHTQYLLADGTRTLTGNLTITGTVDGRDVAADGTTQDAHIADGTIHFTEGSIDHGSIGGLGDDDHVAYHTDTRGDVRYPRRLDGAGAPGGSTGNGYALGTVYADTTNDDGYILVDATTDANVWSRAGSDHGGLSGLLDDDHTQYHNDARGDARYTPIAHGAGDGSDHADVAANTSAITTKVEDDGAHAQGALLIAERADHVNVPATGFSEVWLNSAITPPRLMFTNESGVDGTVVVHRSGAPGNNAILTGYGTEGTVDSTTLFTYNSGNGELALAQWAGGPLRMKEGAAISVAPGATMGSVWVKDDDPNRLHYYDEASDHTLAYLSELNDGTVDHGSATGLLDDDHTQYATVDGTRNVFTFGSWNFEDPALGTPGTGGFDTDNANTATTTTIRFTMTGNNEGVAMNPYMADIETRGWLRLRDTADSSHYVSFYVTAVTDVAAVWVDFSVVKLLGASEAWTTAEEWDVTYFPLANKNSLRLVERADHEHTPAALYGELWLRSDADQSLILTDDAGTDRELLDHRGMVPQDAAYFTDRADHVNAPGGTKSELWTRTATSYPELIFTDKSGLDWTVGKSYLPAQGEIPYWTVSGSGDYLTVHDNLKFDGLSLQLGGASASLDITERTSTPASVATKGKLWNGDIYEEHTSKLDSAQDAPSPTWTDADGNETNLSWLSRNYAKTLGMRMAFHSSGERDIYAVAGTPSSGDGAIGFLCDDFSGHFYRTAFDTSLGDYIAGDSADGYTWAHTTIDSSTTSYDMARPVSNGQFVATACDSLVYLSTDLTLGNLVYKSTVPSATESSNMFWHEGSSLWVHVGYSGATGYIHTSPDCVTWTQRYTRGSRTWICGDIVTVPWWSQSYGVVSGQLERICLWNNGTSEMVYSDNATSWFADTTSQPTLGLISVCWCPQMGSEDSKDFGGGCWWGMDYNGAIWHTIGYGAGTWYAATYTGYQLLNAKGDFSGWGNRVSGAATQTIYQHTKVGDQGANDIMYDNVATLREALTMYWQSSSTTHYAQYAWGNGVILWASGDLELIVGRYGPTRKSSSGPYA